MALALLSASFLKEPSYYTERNIVIFSTIYELVMTQLCRVLLSFVGFFILSLWHESR